VNTDRIKEIQKATAYPDSASVQQALLQVWNECQQDSNKANSVDIEELAKMKSTNYELQLQNNLFSEEIERLRKMLRKEGVIDWLDPVLAPINKTRGIIE